MITRIETEAVYHGRCDNGVIITGPTFKGVYRACLREMRDSYGHNLFFEIGRCEFEYGAEMVIYDDSQECPHSVFEPTRRIGELTVFSIDRKTQIIFRRDLDDWHHMAKIALSSVYGKMAREED